MHAHAVGPLPTALTSSSLVCPTQVDNLQDISKALRICRSAAVPGTDTVISLRVSQTFKVGKPVSGTVSFVELACPTAGELSPSVSSVANVLSMLSQKVLKLNPPFSSSKTAHVLRESLNGACLVTLLVELAPSRASAAHTARALQFATRCRASEQNEEQSDKHQVRLLAQQVTRLETEIETTHAYYQKVIESVMGQSRAKYMGQLERSGAAGVSQFGSRRESHAGTPSGGTTPGGRRSTDGRSTAGGGGGALRMADVEEAMEELEDKAGGPANEALQRELQRVEARARVLETQLEAQRAIASELEQRLQHKHMEMEEMTEKHMAKEHAQFKENKRLNARITEMKESAADQVQVLQSQMDATKAAHEGELKRYQAEAEALRKQLAEMSASISGLMESQSAGAAAKRKEKEDAFSQADAKVRAQMSVVESEKRSEIESIKMTFSQTVKAREGDIAALREAATKERVAAHAEVAALQEELRYLLDFTSKSLALLTAPPAVEPAVGSPLAVKTTGGLSGYKKPPQPPSIDVSKTPFLKTQAAEKLQFLVEAAAKVKEGRPLGVTATMARDRALSSAAATPPRAASEAAASGSAADSPSSSQRGGGGSEATPPPPAASGAGAGAAPAEQQRIRELEAQVTKYRAEMMAERRKAADLMVSLRSMQRAESSGVVALSQSISGPLLHGPSFPNRPVSAMPTLGGTVRGGGPGVIGPAALASPATLVRGTSALSAARAKTLALSETARNGGGAAAAALGRPMSAAVGASSPTGRAY